jgi:excisionase family DNA binding protein
VTLCDHASSRLGPYSAHVAKLWRVQQVADYLGVSHQRVSQMAAKGRLPVRTEEGRGGRRWRPIDVRQWAKAWAAERSWRRLAD